MIRLNKEDRLAIRQKMDAVTLQGVWLGFSQPASTTAGHGSRAVANLYRMLLEQEMMRNRQMGIKKSRREMRVQLLDEVEKRIVQTHNDDLMLIFAS